MHVITERNSLVSVGKDSDDVFYNAKIRIWRKLALRQSCALSTTQSFAYTCAPSRMMECTRMWETATPANNAVLLFGTKAVEERLASRIYDLLDVTVDPALLKIGL